MSSIFLIIGAIFVGIAGLIHIAIFVFESVLWNRPSTWKRFGVKGQADADVLRPMAYNQGFYNLFLGIGAALGLVLWWTGHDTAGRTLALFCTGSMAAAAAVLVTTGRSYVRAALTQGTLPLIGFVLTLLS